MSSKGKLHVLGTHGRGYVFDAANQLSKVYYFPFFKLHNRIIFLCVNPGDWVARFPGSSVYTTVVSFTLLSRDSNIDSMRL